MSKWVAGTGLSRERDSPQAGFSCVLQEEMHRAHFSLPTIQARRGFAQMWPSVWMAKGDKQHLRSLGAAKHPPLALLGMGRGELCL